MTPSSAPLVGVVRPWGGAPPPPRALRALASRPHPFLRWAAGGPRDLARWSFAASDPTDVLRTEVTRSGPREDPWRRVAARWPVAIRRVGPRVPFAGGWAGLLGYELRAAVEKIPPPRPSPKAFPALWLARYDAVVAWDRRTGRAFLAGLGTDAREARAAADRLRERLRGGASARPPAPASIAGGVAACVDPATYRHGVAALVERIRAGDLFQANLSQRFEGRFDGDPVDLFLRLAQASPVPFLTYVDLGGGRRVLSASPERFLSLRGSRAQTRPMKGTRPRGASAALDRALVRELEASPKERAELAMIVDLSRNDLGRVCRPGTVRVQRARRLERYATVHQAVGIVVGRLSQAADGLDLVRAAFPPGSVTGAPKVEAMRAIDRLEGEARGPYCGAVGWFDEGGDLDLAVAIRTLCLDGRRVSYRVGGGVTLLSDPEEERRETLDKGLALERALAGARGAPRASGRRP